MNIVLAIYEVRSSNLTAAELQSRQHGLMYTCSGGMVGVRAWALSLLDYSGRRSEADRDYILITTATSTKGILSFKFKSEM